MVALGFAACNSDITDINVDIKNPTEVSAGALFASATISLSDFLASTNVNTNNFRLWSQQWAQTTYADESNFDLVTRDVNGNTWDRLYATVIRDVRGVAPLAAVDPFLNDENRRNQYAIAEVLEIFTWHILVDIFGDIPYSQALTDDVTPGYDDDAVIYADLAARLDKAISDLSGASEMGAADLIYGGDVSKWRKFANSLKLRMAIRMADVDAGKAKTMAETAVADGVFTSSADDFALVYTSATPNTNPLWEDLVQSGRSDFVIANTLADYMNGLEDPRRPFYFRDQYDVDGTLEWVGGVYGANNAYNANSHPGTLLLDATFPGTNMGYTEVLFLLADAAARGFSVGGTVEDFYAMGITNSILEWGGTQDDVDTYLARTDVAYATAAGEWKDKIGLQKWLALYNQGLEAWSTYRLYNAPEMNIAQDAGTLPPMRYTYPVDEYSLNEENVKAAGATIGGDDLMTPVFWDVN
ncbi:MAG: hypothetical protein DHS20C18_45660 [Saprospiraceae bacterium]|nr:MAG: hypothetical protein DHS20C18_45660 [Saprospiraceae bacterium]